jgi:hypothetical protein
VRLQVLAMTAVLLSAAPSLAAAQDDPCLFSALPWVAVAFSGSSFTQELERAVLLDLRAGLRLKGIEACVIGRAGKEPPLAVLQLSAASPDRFTVSIEVNDALTEKRVLRDIDMTGVSPDARSLTIAAATDELLRASWVELALADAPEPSREPPAAVTEAVRDTIEPARVGQRDLALGVRFESAYFGAGLGWLGADLLATSWLSDYVGLELAAGARAGLPREGEHGEVKASALLGGLALRVALVERTAPLGVDALVGAAVASVRMRGEAREGGRSFTDSAIDVHALFGLLFRASLAPWLDLRLELGTGAPIQGVEATDEGVVAASTHGIQLRAALGAELKL